MECCGKERTTKYCPDCGKELNADAPLAGLLRHCESTLEAANKKRKEATEAKDDKSLVSAEKSIAKWHQWVCALEAVVQGGMKGEPEE